MTLTLNRILKRASAGLMLSLALMYLLLAGWHPGQAEVAVHPSGAAVAMGLDPYVYAEGQSGDGVVGCHFFCNHGCPIPPLPDLPGVQISRAYTMARTSRTRCAHPQPIKAPPRILA